MRERLIREIGDYPGRKIHNEVDGRLLKGYGWLSRR
jgi:hypothetical protein